MNNKKVAVLMGGLSAERDISLKSGMAVHQALIRLGYDSVAIDLRGEVATILKEERPDLVFIALHGRYGEDGCIQGLLELMQIPYTGSGVLASGLAMHKLYSKQVFAAAGLAITPYVPLQRGGELKLAELPFGLPLVVKPVQEGSSVGVSIVKSEQQLEAALQLAFEYDDTVLVEQYIKGKEVQVGILDDSPIGAIEIEPKNEFYDYEAKYTDGMALHHFPARLDPPLYEKVQQLGLKAHHALGCDSYSRVDFLVTDGGECYLLEVNTLPGMTPLSLLPEIAEKGAGIGFDRLVEQILQTARLKIKNQAL